MRAAGVVRSGYPGGPVGDLRRIVNFHGWNGAVKARVLVVNRDVADDVAAIFADIFDAGFPIRSMKPIEGSAVTTTPSMAATTPRRTTAVRLAGKRGSR